MAHIANKRLAAGLLVVALALVALSFVDWGEAAGAAPPATTAVSPPATPGQTPAEMGQALFQAKGCTSCHRHDGVGVARVAAGGAAGAPALAGLGAPDLTHYQPEPDFVRRWLRDPRAVRPGTAMPNLRLSDADIEALLAFLQTNQTNQP